METLDPPVQIGTVCWVEVEGSPKFSRRNDIVDNASFGGAIHLGQYGLSAIDYEIANSLCKWP